MIMQDSPRQKAGANATNPIATRPVIRGTEGMVSAGHYLTTMSAVRMLLTGGNAFDAAVAAGFTAAVLEPIASYSLAAEGVFMLYHAGSRQLRALSGQGVAAQSATVKAFKQKGYDKVPTGPGPDAGLSFTVPGVVDAFLLLLQDYGTKTVGETLAPAIEYAQRGFPMYPMMWNRLQNTGSLQQFAQFPPGPPEALYQNGVPHPVGRIVVQKQLGETMLKLVHAEYEARGHRQAGIQAARDIFYRGELARTIVRSSERVGGLLSLDDLDSYHAQFDEPVQTTFMGHQICGQSAWTQAPVLLQSLNILEHFDLRSMGHNSPQYIHTVTEALKLAFADRERYYGDPDFSDVPVEDLLSKEYAAARVALIQPDRAFPELPPPGDPVGRRGEVTVPSNRAQELVAPIAGDGGGQAEDGTTHFAVIDRDGNMVCVTPSGGAFDKSVYFPELGCTLSTRSEMFFLDEDHANGLQPGKRPRTTLVNYMICKDGQPFMTIGCPGGDKQAQADLQLVLNVLVFGMDPQQAVEAPRFATQSVTNSFYPRTYLPGQLDVEPGITAEVRTKLTALGHKVVESATNGLGAIVAERNPETGAMSAGADPRRTSYAIGW